MDGTTSCESEALLVRPHDCTCPQCRLTLTCVYCGQPLGDRGGCRGRRPLTCARASCRQRLEREWSRACYWRRRVLLDGQALPPGRCRVCFYALELCRCAGTSRRRRGS